MRIPFLVVHGEEDPLVTLSGGEATANAIAGSRLLTFPGMGHDLPPQLQEEITDAMAANALSAPRQQSDREDGRQGARP